MNKISSGIITIPLDFIPKMCYNTHTMENHVNPKDHALAFALLGTGKVNITSKCWYWTGPRSAGIGILHVNGISWKAHEAAMILFKGHLPNPKGLHINHACRNLSCIRPSHLYWAKRNEDKLNPFRQLNPHEIEEIARRFASGRAYSHIIAEEYGVSEHKIRDAVRGYPGSWARFYYKTLVNDRRDR